MGIIGDDCRPSRLMASVDILLCSCSSQRVLERTIDSVRKQTFSDWRLIIIDDNSDEDAKRYMNQLVTKDSTQIKLITNKERKGLTRSLCEALIHIEAKLVARIDAGDRWYPNKLEMQVRHLDADKGCALIGSQVKFVDRHGETIGLSNFPTSSEEIARVCTSFRGLFAHSAILFRRTDIWYDVYYERSQDYALYLEMISRGKQIANLEQTLVETLVDIDGISIYNKPSQIYYMKRARSNYRLRQNGSPEVKIAFKSTYLKSVRWKIASPLYLRYISARTMKRNMAVFWLLSCLLVFPELIGLYTDRLRRLEF